MTVPGITKAPEISVIVPIYNGEAYIDSIIDNMRRQRADSIEIVFVDDGSADSSYEKILAARESLDKSEEGLSIRCISISNGGVGRARNKGIGLAAGKYLAFMDQDDYLDDDYFVSLLAEMKKTKADIVYSGYREVYPNGTPKRIVTLAAGKENQFICTAGWAKLFNREFIVGNRIHFAQIPLGEDIFFTVEAFSKAETVSYLDYVGYNWVVNTSSLSRSQQTTLSDKMNVLPLLTLLGKTENFPKWSQDEVYEYLMIKTVEFYILSAVSATPVREIFRYRDNTFHWLEQKFPKFTKNRLVSLRHPAGEPLKVRAVVWLYTQLYRLKLDKAVLWVLSHFRLSQ